MTAPTATRRDAATDGGPADRRRLRGAVLLVGAVALLVLVVVLDVPFYWLPTITGGVYLAGAVASGVRGALWAPGLVVLGFGLGIVTTTPALELFAVESRPAAGWVGAGIGAVLAVLAARVGVAVSATSVAVTVLLLAVFVALTTRVGSVFSEAYFYAALLAVWGAWELRPSRD